MNWTITVSRICAWVALVLTFILWIAGLPASHVPAMIWQVVALLWMLDRR